MPPGPGTSIGALISVAVHAAALVGLYLHEPPREPATVVLALTPTRGAAAPPVVEDNAVLLGAPPLPPLGPADFLAPREVAPRSGLDVPDLHAASRPDAIGREDREELRSQLWNDPTAYRIPRVRTGDRRATNEALSRTPRPGLDAAQRKRATLARLERVAPPRTGGSPDPEAARAVTGALESAAAHAFIAAGPTAVDTSHSAPFDDAQAPRDDSTSAQASDERHPEPFDLGHDGGGSSLDVERGAGQPSTRARRQDDYFRRLHARVLERVRWPRALAVALEQGEVVVTFTLRRDGTVAQVLVARPSGFHDLDDAVITAIHEAAPFGPVPSSIPGGANGDVRISAPFTFENPILR